MKKTKEWLKVFDALSAYANSQEQCEAMTNDVMRALTN